LDLELHPAAVEEAGDSYAHYSRRDSEIGERFLDALEVTFDAILKTPYRFPKYQHGTRRALVKGFPFQVVFQVRADRVRIIAVAHHRQEPGYWATRE